MQRNMQKVTIYRHPTKTGEHQQVNIAKANVLNASTLVMLALAIGIIGATLWLVGPFIWFLIAGATTVVGLAFLIITCAFCALFTLKGRRKLTAEQIESKATLLQVSVDAQKAATTKLLTKDTTEWDTETEEQKVAVSQRLRNGFLFECLTNLLWGFVVVLHGISGTNQFLPVSVLGYLASICLAINFFKYGVWYIAWPVISEKPATHESLGSWLFERSCYALVALYVLAFFGVKFIA